MGNGNRIFELVFDELDLTELSSLQSNLSKWCFDLSEFIRQNAEI